MNPGPRILRQCAFGCFATVVIAAAVGTVVGAKVPTSRLAISGGRIAGEVEVLNRKALVNIWDGRRGSESWLDFPQPFFGPLAPEPDPRLPRYRVTFYIDSPSGAQKRYMVRYVPDPLTGLGFVYLPLPTDPDGSLNGIVIRQGKDGRWLRASSEWSQALNAQIASSLALDDPR